MTEIPNQERGIRLDTPQADKVGCAQESRPLEQVPAKAKGDFHASTILLGGCVRVSGGLTGNGPRPSAGGPEPKAIKSGVREWRWRIRVLRWIDVVVFLGFGVFIVSRELWNVQYFIGIGIAVVGFALWMLARLQLGRSFGIGAQAKALVTTGLYSKFRHPIYLFGGIAYAGLFIAWAKTIPFLLYLLISTVQVLRFRKEERVLEQAFGEEYRRYKASTWF